MGLFDFFKKKEVESVNSPIKEILKSEPIKSTSNNLDFNFTNVTGTVMVIEGYDDEVDSAEIVDFVEHDEISDEAKELTKEYLNSLKGNVFYSHKKFFKLQDSPYKCKNKAKTQVWLYNLIKYKSVIISCKYIGKELIELDCIEMPELNCMDKEKLIIIEKEMKSN